MSTHTFQKKIIRKALRPFPPVRGGALAGEVHGFLEFGADIGLNLLDVGLLQVFSFRSRASNP